MIKAGIDIIEISRVAEKIKRNESFVGQILTEKEIDYCNSKTINVEKVEKQFQTIAGIYSAKEAFFKALGTGIGSVSNLKKVEICHNECGAPYIEVLDKCLLETIKTPQNISVSISHDGNIATAICIIES